MLKKKVDVEKPLKSLSNFIKNNKLKLPERLPSISSGIFGYMGYEMIQFFENVKLSKKNTMDLPDSIFLRPSVTLVFDNVNDKIIISQLVSKEINKNAEQMFKSIKKSIYDIKKNICKPIKKKYFEEKKSNISVDIFKNVETNPSFEDFKYMIKRAKKYIQEGEIFQVVLSRLFKKKLKYHQYQYTELLDT